MSVQLALLAAAAAGLVNALAGGGTLLLFPALLGLGLPAVSASVHSTVALCPGYLGATLAQRPELRGQGARLLALLPLAALGGFAGALLLLHTGEAAFRVAVPWLLLAACLLLALQEPLRKRWAQITGSAAPAPRLVAALAVGVASIYGGYFGAGLSVLVLALLGLLLHEGFNRLNALKQAVALAANLGAAAVFLLRAPLQWPLLIALALAALAGGWLGGRLAGRVPPARLRALVVVLGFALTLYYFIRGAGR
jgi:hypothetical protein